MMLSDSLFYLQRTQRLNLLCKILSHLGKSGSLRGRNPLKANAFRLNPQHGRQLFSCSEHLFSFYITIQVMTVTDVSAGDKDTVSPILKPFENKIGVYPSGAHHTNDAHIRGILKPADASQICR